MIYLDTSSLLKLLYNEPESPAVEVAVAGEPEVSLSSIARLEARVQLKSAWLGGDFSKLRYQALVRQLDELEAAQPFRSVTLGGTIFRTAIRQNAEAKELHLRTLDRLHLAAMEELGLTRLMTHDANQALAAKALGFEVASPGVD